MKKILILCRHDERNDYDQIETFSSGLSSISTKSDYAFGELEQLVFAYDGHELRVLLNGEDIREYDELFLIGWFKSKILEDIALSVARYMDYHKKPVRNSEILFTRSRSKLSQYVVAALNGVNLTPFVFCKDPAVVDASFDKLWVQSYPLIMKGVQASRGNDNYLIKDRQSVSQTLALTDDEDGPWFVVQGFVPNDGDYRIIVMGDEVTYAIHRKSQSESHLNNTSKGGAAQQIDPSELPAEVIAQCVKLSKLLRREITGVDMIQHTKTGEFYLLEINNMPQMATGSFVPEKLTKLDAYLTDVVDGKK
jgi:glutathione synthase/RimK-type ligase-like ATP-grasp enzyme